MKKLKHREANYLVQVTQLVSDGTTLAFLSPKHTFFALCHLAKNELIGRQAVLMMIRGLCSLLTSELVQNLDVCKEH